MNPGVVSLRCPACARPFLSLPLQRESAVTCPHCQRQGVAGSFAAAGAAPGEALVQSLRQRVLQPSILRPRPSAATGAWPVAPPIFAGPARQPPLTAEEPQWPFIPEETDEPPSPFSLLEASRQRAAFADADADPYLPERSERNVPLGFFLLVLVMAGLWLGWQMLQPPMVVEIPIVPPTSSAQAQTYGALPSEAAATVDLPPELEKYPAILAR